jgi:hypothetical protein
MEQVNSTGGFALATDLTTTLQEELEKVQHLKI